MSAALCRSVTIVVATLLAVCAPRSATAQAGSTAPPSQQDEHRVAETVKFLAGGAFGLVMHESGHLVFDVAFDADARIEPVHFGPFPFFAIAHRADLSPRRELTISSAGFWVQEASSEWLLTTRPNLHNEKAPLVKGLLAFNVLNSLGYGLVAFARAGPHERDTRGMADASRVDERAIAAIVITPAFLDGYRYFRPESKWAKWASRAAKAGSVLLLLRGT